MTPPATSTTSSSTTTSTTTTATTTTSTSFGAQYLWVFHFGRPALKWLLAPVAAAAATDGKGKKFLMRAPLLHAAGAFVHPLKLKQIPLSVRRRRRRRRRRRPSPAPPAPR